MASSTRMMTLSVVLARVAGNEPQRHPDHSGHQHGPQGHEQRRPRGVDDAAQDVAAEVVGPEEVGVPTGV